ncbi:MAG: aminopeptidase P family N-terminal domain-containing protein, partial [Rubrobacteraceae bacterium]|nr:aminopeptidase P family N-terminal domain-containing protein [Rubrobacteraceae bacterium]
MSRESRDRSLRELMDGHGVGALLLSSPANFAWYTGGADNRVDHGDPVGVASVLVTTDDAYILTNNIEAPRMREEQTPVMEVVEHPWHEEPAALLKELTGAGVGTDVPSTSGPDLSAEIPPLRYVLDGDAIEDYRRLGADTAHAVSEAAGSLSPDTDELEAAAELSAACLKRDIFVPVLLAASEERLVRYRHPIPHGGPLGRQAMLVVCAERGGLFVSLTRMIYFEEPDPQTARRQDACEEVLSRMREEATREGRTLAQAFEDCRRFYGEAGFAEGWRDHHQGGMTGYASRELIATPGTHQEIREGQAFAWNPSLEGAK